MSSKSTSNQVVPHDNEAGQNNENNIQLEEFKSTQRLQDETKDDFVHREGGFGWVVVIACGYCFGVLIGMITNYALIFNGLEIAYNQTENHIIYAAWIGSFSVGVQYLFSFVSSVLISLTSIRVISLLGGLLSTLGLAGSAFIAVDMRLYFLSYGLVFGIGQAFLLIATSSILPHYFKKRLSLANGVMIFVSAVMIVALPVSTHIFLESHGLKFTFLILAAFNALTILMSFTYKEQIPKDTSGSLSSRIKSSFGFSIFKNMKYVGWCVGSFIALFGYLIPIVNIDHHSIKAFPEHNPVYNNVIFGVTSAVGGLIFGKIGDLTKFNHIFYHSLVMILYGIVELTLPFAPSSTVFIVQMAILGVLDGLFLTFIVPIAYDLTENTPELTNQAIGFFYVSCFLPSVVGPALAGFLYETFSSYNNAFYIGGAACLLGGLIQGLVFIKTIKKSK